MEYRQIFSIFNFEFWGKAYTYLVGLKNEEILKLNRHIEERFVGYSPLDYEINQFVSEECDEFFEELKQLRK